MVGLLKPFHGANVANVVTQIDWMILLRLQSTYFPRHEENLMAHEGDVERARESFINHRKNNLNFLLENRYGWMNDYIDESDKVVELGCGAGFSKLFIDHHDLTLTDVVEYEWVDEIIDALDLPYEDASVDAFICSHMIHHVAKPKTFIKSLFRALKKGGRIIIHEVNISLFLQLALRLMRHEGWSFDIDPFDEDRIANNPDDPWSANCAIPYLLFKDSKTFERNFPGFEIILNQPEECFLLPLSGGVISKRPVIELPMPVLRFVKNIDDMLCRLSPDTFAVGRRVVIMKR